MNEREDTQVSTPGGAPRPLRFQRRLRLTHRREFEAVYAERVRHFAGPLRVYARPNDLDHPRLGLSVSRRVGSAVTRNRIKRRLREAFRHLQHDLPTGYDVAISVQPHEPLRMAEYQRLLFTALRSLHTAWSTKTPSPPRDESDSSRES